MAAARRRAQRFTRQRADDRRIALVEAALESLKRHGHEGLAVRQIAATANVSSGLINHHFPNKDALVAAAYRHFHRQLLDGIEAAVARAAATPRARLRAFIEATFAPPNLDRDVLTAWLVFWSLYRTSSAIQRVHRATYRGYLDTVRELLTDLAGGNGRITTAELRLAAIGLTALLDGLWLEWCLDPDTFSPREAVALCESWTERLRAQA
jgi:TetR/AcrR family transcriptional repressor of bet genes